MAEKFLLSRVTTCEACRECLTDYSEMCVQVSSLDHPFVVPFVEGWVDRGHTINIVYGYCRNGDLGSLLHSHKAQMHFFTVYDSKDACAGTLF